MNKCFITKLPSSVDNDNLPVLGQLRINWLKQSNLTNNDARAIELITNDNITVKVSGAHFTDSTLASNLGNTKIITVDDGTVRLYVSNDADAILTIDNKYSLTGLGVISDSLARSIYFDIEDIKYCTNLSHLNLSNTQVSGDINAVSNLTNLVFLRLNNTQVSGDINAVRNLTNLTYLFDLSNTQISGDINAVRNLTNLRFLGLNNIQVSGDINAVSQLTALTGLILNNTQVSGDINAVSQLTALTSLNLSYTQVSGEIDSLANLTKLSNSNFTGLSLTGDMSKIPAGINFISQANRKFNTNFTWTANGRRNAALIAMDGNVPFDTVSMDNMFIDQATCTFKPTNNNPLTRIISVNGTRTSASDAAVVAIQNMGVTITGVTKQD